MQSTAASACPIRPIQISRCARGGPPVRSSSPAARRPSSKSGASRMGPVHVNFYDSSNLDVSLRPNLHHRDPYTAPIPPPNPSRTLTSG
jgi:hypothetical protein